jgi:hypothetical protein
MARTSSSHWLSSAESLLRPFGVSRYMRSSRPLSVGSHLAVMQPLFSSR